MIILMFQVFLTLIILSDNNHLLTHSYMVYMGTLYSSLRAPEHEFQNQTQFSIAPKTPLFGRQKKGFYPFAKGYSQYIISPVDRAYKIKKKIKMYGKKKRKTGKGLFLRERKRDLSAAVKIR